MMPSTRTFKARKCEPASHTRSGLDQRRRPPAFIRRGAMGVVLGIYLFRIRLSSLVTGSSSLGGWLGSALATIVMTLAADRIG